MFRALMMTVIALCLSACQKSHLEIFPALDNPLIVSQKLAVVEMSEDIDFLVSETFKRHPNLAQYTEIEDLQSYADELKKQLTQPMTRVEFYQVIGRLNHVFNDGHSFLIWPYQEWASLKEGGNKPFPFEVKITPDDKIVLAKDYMSGEEKLFAGQVIQQINGVSSIQLLNEMQRYVGGESLKLRKQVVARRFPILLWAVYGFINDFDLKVSDTQFKLLTNKDWQSDKPALADHYYKKLNKDTGFLYLSHFDISPEKFEQFIDKTFVEIKDDKVTNLIVDIRYNPGGNTDTVSYLSSYLSNKPFRVASSVKERLNEDNRGVFNYKGDVGEIIHQSWDETVLPIDSKNRFGGDVYVLVGSVSYSAAIVFATTLQDNNIATLVGEVTGGYANQSAQGNLFNLPNSQLRAYITTRLIVRPNGNESQSHVVPDYIVEETQTSIKNGQDVMIDKVLNIIKSGA